jgi:hypothetical protein
LARLGLHNSELLFHICQGDALPALLDAWLDRTDEMVESHMRKLSALGLCNMLPTSNPYVLQRLPGIIAVVTMVLHDVEDDDKGYEYALLYFFISFGHMTHDPILQQFYCIW